MTILVIAEHDNSRLKPDTHKAIAAALQLGQDVDVLVMGQDCQAVANAAASLSGVRQVLYANHPAYHEQLAENCAALIAELATDYQYFIAPATSNGKNILPRVAAVLDVPMLSDVLSVVSANTFTRPIYAGNAIATVQCEAAKKVLTVRSSAFNAVAETGAAVIVDCPIVKDTGLSRFISASLTKSARPELTSARVVISGGRGMQNGENFKLLDGIADKLGAAIGASRAAVDAGFVPNDMQVGQTGKIVAPDLYIAVGISGAIQHLAGMKDSKVIVAINKDPEAPIFQVADYGLVGDLFTVLPELEAALS